MSALIAFDGLKQTRTLGAEAVSSSKKSCRGAIKRIFALVHIFNSSEVGLFVWEDAGYYASRKILKASLEKAVLSIKVERTRHIHLLCMLSARKRSKRAVRPSSMQGAFYGTR